MNGSDLFKNENAAKPHLVAGAGGVSGEIADLRADLKRVLGKLAPISVDEYTNPAAADTDGILLAKACTVATQTYDSVAELDGVTAGTLSPPRNVTVTTAGSTPADAPATLTVTGTYLGKPQTETINVGQTATTVAGTKPFDKVTKLELSAGQGTDATVAVGFGAGLGLGQPIKTRGGIVSLIHEVSAGAVVTTGAVTALGLYTPAAAPDAARDYAVYFEMDPAA